MIDDLKEIRLEIPKIKNGSRMTRADKIFMFLSFEAIACGLISGVYILVGGANGIHI